MSSKLLGKYIYSQKKQKSHWNSKLPVGTVPATVLTKRQNTGNLHLKPCKIIF